MLKYWKLFHQLSIVDPVETLGCIFINSLTPKTGILLALDLFSGKKFLLFEISLISFNLLPVCLTFKRSWSKAGRPISCENHIASVTSSLQNVFSSSELAQLGTPSRKNYGIVWEFSPSGTHPPFWELIVHFFLVLILWSFELIFGWFYGDLRPLLGITKVLGVGKTPPPHTLRKISR